MVRLLGFLSLFIAFTANAAVTPSGVPSIGLGGANLNGQAIVTDGTNSQGWFTLHLGGTITTNQFRAFVKSGGSQYQVPAGGITCFHMTYNSNGVGNRFQLASSTAADGITANTLSAGQKYESGGASSGFLHVTAASSVDYDKAIVYSFDANAYPYAAADTTAVYTIILTCKAN